MVTKWLIPNGYISTQVDGEIRQKGSTKDMMFKIPFLISHISSIMTLLEGDVILTGIMVHFSLFICWNIDGQYHMWDAWLSSINSVHQHTQGPYKQRYINPYTEPYINNGLAPSSETWKPLMHCSAAACNGALLKWYSMSVDFVNHTEYRVALSKLILTYRPF